MAESRRYVMEEVLDKQTGEIRQTNHPNAPKPNVTNHPTVPHSDTASHFNELQSTMGNNPNPPHSAVTNNSNPSHSAVTNNSNASQSSVPFFLSGTNWSPKELDWKAFFATWWPFMQCLIGAACLLVLSWLAYHQFATNLDNRLLCLPAALVLPIVALFMNRDAISSWAKKLGGSCTVFTVIAVILAFLLGILTGWEFSSPSDGTTTPSSHGGKSPDCPPSSSPVLVALESKEWVRDTAVQLQQKECGAAFSHTEGYEKFRQFSTVWLETAQITTKAVDANKGLRMPEDMPRVTEETADTCTQAIDKSKAVFVALDKNENVTTWAKNIAYVEVTMMTLANHTMARKHIRDNVLHFPICALKNTHGLENPIADFGVVPKQLNTSKNNMIQAFKTEVHERNEETRLKMKNVALTLGKFVLITGGTALITMYGGPFIGKIFEHKFMITLAENQAFGFLGKQVFHESLSNLATLAFTGGGIYKQFLDWYDTLLGDQRKLEYMAENDGSDKGFLSLDVLKDRLDREITGFGDNFAKSPGMKLYDLLQAVRETKQLVEKHLEAQTFSPMVTAIHTSQVIQEGAKHLAEWSNDKLFSDAHDKCRPSGNLKKSLAFAARLVACAHYDEEGSPKYCDLDDTETKDKGLASMVQAKGVVQTFLSTDSETKFPLVFFANEVHEELLKTANRWVADVISKLPEEMVDNVDHDNIALKLLPRLIEGLQADLEWLADNRPRLFELASKQIALYQTFPSLERKHNYYAKIDNNDNEEQRVHKLIRFSNVTKVAHTNKVSYNMLVQTKRNELSYDNSLSKTLTAITNVTQSMNGQLTADTYHNVFNERVGIWNLLANFINTAGEVIGDTEGF